MKVTLFNLIDVPQHIKWTDKQHTEQRAFVTWTCETFAMVPSNTVP